MAGSDSSTYTPQSLKSLDFNWSLVENLTVAWSVVGVSFSVGLTVIRYTVLLTLSRLQAIKMYSFHLRVRRNNPGRPCHTAKLPEKHYKRHRDVTVTKTNMSTLTFPTITLPTITNPLPEPVPVPEPLPTPPPPSSPVPSSLVPSSLVPWQQRTAFLTDVAAAAVEVEVEVEDSTPRPVLSLEPHDLLPVKRPFHVTLRDVPYVDSAVESPGFRLEDDAVVANKLASRDEEEEEEDDGDGWDEGCGWYSVYRPPILTQQRRQQIIQRLTLFVADVNNASEGGRNHFIIMFLDYILYCHQMDLFLKTVPPFAAGLEKKVREFLTDSRATERIQRLCFRILEEFF